MSLGRFKPSGGLLGMGCRTGTYFSLTTNEVKSSMRKRPVGIGILRMSSPMDRSRSKNKKRSRSEYIELYFEELFFKPEQPVEIAIKTG